MRHSVHPADLLAAVAAILVLLASVNVALAVSPEASQPTLRADVRHDVWRQVMSVWLPAAAGAASVALALIATFSMTDTSTWIATDVLAVAVMALAATVRKARPSRTVVARQYLNELHTYQELKKRKGVVPAWRLPHDFSSKPDRYYSGYPSVIGFFLATAIFATAEGAVVLGVFGRWNAQAFIVLAFCYWLALIIIGVRTVNRVEDLKASTGRLDLLSMKRALWIAWPFALFLVIIVYAAAVPSTFVKQRMESPHWWWIGPLGLAIFLASLPALSWLLIWLSLRQPSGTLSQSKVGRVTSGVVLWPYRRYVSQLWAIVYGQLIIMQRTNSNELARLEEALGESADRMNERPNARSKRKFRRAGR